MSEGSDQETGKGRLSLRPTGRLELGRTVDAGSVRQSFSHGRSKVVQVEVRKKRAAGPATPGPATPSAPASTAPAMRAASPARSAPAQPRALTASELAARQRALVEQQREQAKRDAERREQEKISILSAAEEARRREEEARRAAEEEERLNAEIEAQRQAEEQAQPVAAEEPAPATAGAAAPAVEARETRDAPRTDAPRPAARPAASAAAPAARRPTGAPATPARPTETLRLRPGARPGEEEEESRPVRRPGGLGSRRASPPSLLPRRVPTEGDGPVASTCRPRWKAMMSACAAWPPSDASASASAARRNWSVCDPIRCAWCAT